MLEYNDEQSVDTLIDHVFPDLGKNCTFISYMRERAILSTRNEHVDSLNVMMIAKFPGKKRFTTVMIRWMMTPLITILLIF